jgi:energy-converting hydrogenase Eha subunit C
MNRVVIACGAFAAAMLALPEYAHAAGRVAILGASPLNLIISLSGLAVALILLVEVITLRRVALGGAIAERISYVVLAIVCLGASALAEWTRNFVHGVTLQQLNIVAEVLVIVAMGLFAAYFASVRRAFESYLTAMTGGEAFTSEANKGADEGAGASRG